MVMILHLKRFVYDMGRGDVVKRHRLVGYGTELVIPPEIISPGRRGVAVKYRLFGGESFEFPPSVSRLRLLDYTLSFSNT